MERMRTKRYLLAATILTPVVGIPVSAHAQDVAQPSAPVTTEAATAQEQPSTQGEDAADSGGIGDIVVTAQRRSERLQDVPIAVTVVSGESLESKGITNTLDIASVTPGLSFTTTTGTSSPRLRGVGAGSALGGNENSVATYVDGVYLASSAASVLALSNIAQVAVLKGPQGTLFGRNATGGLIQVTTLDPVHEFGGKASLTYGNLNTIGGSLYVTGGLGAAVAADLSVYYNNQQDGFGTNLFTGNDVFKAEDLAVRSKWIVELGDSTTAKITGDYSTLDAAVPGRRLTFGSRPSLGQPFVGGPFDVDSNRDGYFDSERGGGSIELTHEFGAFNLVSITAYREATTNVGFDTDATRLDNSSADNRFKERQFTQELQLVSTGGGPFSWTIGAYYFAARAGYDRVVLRRPTATSQGLVGSEAIFQTYQETKAPAIYGQATYKLTEATSLTLGARYSGEKRDFEANGVTTTLATGGVVVSPPISDNISVERPTWRIALDHRLNPDMLVYASYNRGFKSGGFNGALFESSQPFNPETLDAFEVGFKSDFFDRRLRLNGAAYYYDYQDIQLTNYGQIGVPVFSNAASAEIYGFDIDATAQPIDNLTITAGFAYIHTRLGRFDTAQVSIPLPAGGNAIVQGDSTGNELPVTPNWTLDVGIDYDIPLGNGGLVVSGNYFHSDGWFAETDNRLRQRPYDLLNASLQWYMDPDRGITVTAWGKNLANEVYATQYQARNTGDVISVAAGRTYGVTVGFKF